MSAILGMFAASVHPRSLDNLGCYQKYRTNIKLLTSSKICKKGEIFDLQIGMGSRVNLWLNPLKSNDLSRTNFYFNGSNWLWYAWSWVGMWSRHENCHNCTWPYIEFIRTDRYNEGLLNQSSYWNIWPDQSCLSLHHGWIFYKIFCQISI